MFPATERSKPSSLLHFLCVTEGKITCMTKKRTAHSTVGRCCKMAIYICVVKRRMLSF